MENNGKLWKNIIWVLVGGFEYVLYFYIWFSIMEKKEIKGLGDVVEVITVILGVKKLMPDCNDCKKRRERWNEKIPFKNGKKANP